MFISKMWSYFRFGRSGNGLLRAQGNLAIGQISSFLAKESGVQMIVMRKNLANAGRNLAHALRQSGGKIASVSISIEGQSFGQLADVSLPRALYGSLIWYRKFSAYLRERSRVLIIESGALPFRSFLPRFVEMWRFQRRGSTVLALFHGSDIRSPSAYLRREEWAHVKAFSVSKLIGLELRTLLNRRLVSRLRVPVLLSTPDLIEDVPSGRWLPVVVENLVPSAKPVLADDTVTIVHCPSNPTVKGSEIVDEVLEEIRHEFPIRYCTPRNLEHRELLEIYANGDIVIDQLRVGAYGVAAVEAMALGRLVLAHVSPEVRLFIARATGMELPIVEVNPSNLREVLAEIFSDRTRFRNVAAQGPLFYKHVHSGEFSAGQVLSALAQRAS